MTGHRALEKKQITQGNNRKVQNPSGSPRKKESYIKIALFFYIRIKLVKPRMDFPDQFSKIFLAYQPFPSAPTRKFEAFMGSAEISGW